MAWDFSTEPEFQRERDWVRDVVRAEARPIETVCEKLGQAGFELAVAPLQEEEGAVARAAARRRPALGVLDDRARRRRRRRDAAGHPRGRRRRREHVPTRQAAACERFAALLEAVTSND